MIFTGTAGDDTFTGTFQDDFFDLAQGGNDTVNGGNGGDTFNFGATLTAQDRVDGGLRDGAQDLVNVSGLYTDVINLKGLIHIDSLQFAAGNSYSAKCQDTLVGANKQFVVAAASLGAADNLTFDGSQETNGRFTFISGAGDDALTGGAGSDVFGLEKGGDDTANGGDGEDSFSMAGALTALDRLDGGAGDDGVDLNGDYSAGLVFTKSTLRSIEEMNLAGGNSYTLELVDRNVDGGQFLFVDGTGLNSGNTLIFQGAAETNGSFVIDGGAGADRLTTGAQFDILRGNGGADFLDGGAGPDIYDYQFASNSTGLDHDTIKKFDAALDSFEMPATVTGIDNPVQTGALTSGNFNSDLAAAVNSALDANHAVLFRPDSGDLAGNVYLVVDLNGNGAYQVNADIVIELENPRHISSFSLENFI